MSRRILLFSLVDAEGRFRFPFLWRRVSLQFIFSISSLLSPFSQLTAQNDTLYFRHFSVEQGLSQRNVTSIIQDSLGFMYYGTHEGLNKFDGYSFFPLKHDPENPNSLVSDDITCLTVEKSGIIWIGTRTKGLDRYDPYTGKFTHFTHNAKDPQTICDDRITALYADSVHNALLVGTRDGFCSYDLLTKKFTHYVWGGGACHMEGSPWVTSITRDKNGLIWFGMMGAGINSFDYNADIFTAYNRQENSLPLSNDTVTDIFADRENHLWITTSFGLNRMDLTTHELKKYFHDDKDPGSICSNDLTSVYEDKYGKIWVGTALSGLCVYYPSNDKFFLYSHEKDILNSLSSNHINTISQGRSGMFWAATSDGGLNAFNPKTLKFSLFDPLRTNDDDEIYENAPCISFAQNNVLLIGTKTSGLFMYDQQNGVRHFERSGSRSNFVSGNVINAICKRTDGKFLLCTDNGLDLFDPITYSCVVLSYSDAAAEWVSTSDGKKNYGNITTAHYDSSGNLWFGTDDGKLFSYDEKEKLFSEHDEASGFSIRSIVDDGESVWIGTFGGGLLRYDKMHKVMKQFRSEDGSTHSIGSNFINALLIDKTRTLWVATRGGGFDMLPENSEKFSCFTITDGLADNSLNSVMQDDSSNFWAGTDKGICRLTFRNGKLVQCRVFDLMDGLPTTEFYESSLCGNANGRMFISCGKGIISFHPDSLRNNKYKPPVIITDFSLFNVNILPGDSTGILKTSISVTKELDLNYDQNSFSFQFTAISFINPGKNKYAYMLEGFDKDWNYRTANQRLACYTNMEPGEYVFRVKGSNNDGTWNDVGTSIRIVIRGPFYKSWWFISICVLAGALVLYSIYFFRMRHLLQMQEIRNKISKDLHDEIGSNLSSISVYSEVAKKITKSGSTDAAEVLDNIGESARSSIESMSDIVWAVNPGNDRFGDMMDRVRIFGQKLLAAKDISLEINIPENIRAMKLSMQERKNIYLVLKEAINNVVKYSKARHCSITSEKRGKKLLIHIEDDGCGFDSTPESLGGNGLINMKQRIEELKGTILIQSQTGKGTSILIEINN